MVETTVQQQAGDTGDGAGSSEFTVRFAHKRDRASEDC